MKILFFYLGSFIYSWTVWLLGIYVFGTNINPYTLASIGGLGPVVGLLFYLKFLCNKIERSEYLKRLLNTKHIQVSTWLIAILLPLIITALSNLIDILFFTGNFELLNILKLDEEFLLLGFSYAIFLIFFGPIPEELAWRGVAFNELLNKLGYFKSQLIVALLWALWHFPLFFIKGSYQNSLGINTPDYWMFFINVILNSFITGWLYIKSNRSIILAIIFHYTVNLTGEMFYMSMQGQIIKLVILFTIIFLLEKNQCGNFIMISKEKN